MGGSRPVLRDRYLRGGGDSRGSVVFSLCSPGGWVTATDLPSTLNNLRVNLSRNTRGRCRHTPQVAALPWGLDLEDTHPTSVYQYDYVLAADVVYHHDFLDELLATMKHFCKPGTTLIWANKVRLEADLTFIDKFTKAFNTSLLADDGEIRIFKATCREETQGDAGLDMQDLLEEAEGGEGTGRESEEEGCCHENREDDKTEAEGVRVLEDPSSEEMKVVGDEKKSKERIPGKPDSFIYLWVSLPKLTLIRDVSLVNMF